MSDNEFNEIAKMFTEINNETSDYYVKPDSFETEQVKGFKFPIKKAEGVYLDNAIINLSNLKNMTLRSDDVFLIGFQKSGTTWMQQILWTLLNHLNFEKAKHADLIFRAPWIDGGYLSPKILEKMTSPRIFKSHLHRQLLPENLNKKTRIVYLVRNPKDVVCSLHKFLKSSVPTEFIGTLEDMIELFVEGKILFGPWWEHVNQYAGLENVHFVHYEDLIERPVETIKELAKYLQVDITEEGINQLINFTSFGNMKEMMSEDIKKASMVFKPDIEFFNKGKIGSWKKLISEEQSKKIDEVVAKNLKYQKPIQYEPTIKG